jgi:hypothetical protein
VAAVQGDERARRVRARVAGGRVEVRERRHLASQPKELAVEPERLAVAATLARAAVDP